MQSNNKLITLAICIKNWLIHTHTHRWEGGFYYLL